MANRPQAFRQHHVTRALKAAAAAGMQDPAVTVTLLPAGATITVCSSKPNENVSAGKGALPSGRATDDGRLLKRGRR
jgi:hypothetical protein